MSKVLRIIVGVVEIVAGAVIPGAQGLIVAGVVTIASALLQPGQPKPPATETAVKSPRPPRVSAYGRCRLFPAYVLFTTASNGDACDAYAIHDGRIDGYERYYLGDKIVATSTGVVAALPDGMYGHSTVAIDSRLGLATETAFARLITNLPDTWTADHRGDGVATACVTWKSARTKDYQEIYPNGQPALSVASRWQRVFDWRDETQSVDDPDTWKWSENACLHTAHYKLVREKAKWLASEAFPSGAALTAAWDRYFAPAIDYWTAAADDCDLTIPLKGIQTILTAPFNNGHITMHLDSVAGLTAGMTVVISSTGDTSLTETRTVVSISGLSVVVGTITNDHPQGSQVSWASDPDSPATEPRYRSCVAHQHTDPHKGVVANLLACFDGWMAPRSDGALIVYSGRYYEPTVMIGPDQIVSYSIEDGIAEESAVNQISVTYISGNHDYAQVDTDSWEDDDDIDSRGKILATSINNQVPSFSQARRLAKRSMAEIMSPKRGTTTTNALGRIAIGQRYVRQVIIEADMEFMDAVVQITKLSRNLASGGVTYEWLIADPNIDEWNPATEEGNPAPVGNKVALAPLAEPVITAAVANFTSSTDQGTGTRIDITAMGPDRTDLTWFARWRVVGAAVWNESLYSDTDPGTSVSLQTGFVPIVAAIEVEVAYETGDGRISPYSAPPTDVDTRTDIAVPDAATTATVSSWTDSLNLVTDRISRASSYRWRFYDSTGVTLIRTIVTSVPSVAYTNVQARTDGIARAYVVKVAGINAAGAGTEASTGTVSLPSPATTTGVSATGGATDAEIDFTPLTDPTVIGYSIAISTASGFDPMSQGTIFRSNGTSPAYLSGLAAATFYAKVAAFDAWTDRPNLLNFSSEVTFVITTGGGGVGGGGGDGGGGYDNCLVDHLTALMANDAHDGPGELKRLGDIIAGTDWVWTQHPERDFEWGAYPVTSAFPAEEDVFRASIGIEPHIGTAGHKVWLSGWVEMAALGVPDGHATVINMTIDNAHTFFANGILNHNIKGG